MIHRYDPEIHRHALGCHSIPCDCPKPGDPPVEMEPCPAAGCGVCDVPAFYCRNPAGRAK